MQLQNSVIPELSQQLLNALLSISDLVLDSSLSYH